MSLDIEQINFFIERINSAESSAFPGAIKQLFNYLEKEAFKNPAYIWLEEERLRWANWPGTGGSFGAKWEMPNNLNEAKALSYDLYKSTAEKKDKGNGLTYNLFQQRNLNENIYRFNETFLPYFTKALEDICNAEKKLVSTNEGIIMGNKIFIIHGHDNEMKREVQLLLNRAELEDVVLHERHDKGRTIIVKLIEESSSACYAIALLSADDMLANGKTRTRQNVILEIGYFLGRLGRERVRLLKRGDIEIPSDLQGILYENFDDAGSWRIKLLKEMKAVGIEPNIDNVIEKY